MSHVKEKFRVTYDSAQDNTFYVHKLEKIIQSREAGQRLYYFDTADRAEECTTIVTTVYDNKSKFSSYDYKKAKLARDIQCRIGLPSTQDFICYVNNKITANCPISSQDIKNAEFIWGPDLGSLKGKTVRYTPSSVRTHIYNIPSQIMQQYWDVTLSVDIMKVNNIPFFMTISKHIKFGTTSKLDSMENKIIVKHFKIVFGLYTTSGFLVKVVMADNQFESMRGDIADLGAIINVVSRDKHVPDIERYICTTKELVHATHNIIPFKFIPPIFIVEMVYANVFWRNRFPLKGGISRTQGPAEIILNCAMDFNTYGKNEFGHNHQTQSFHKC